MTFKKVLPLSMIALACFLSDAGAALTARHSHTTTLLPDGNILITGGVTAAGAPTTSVQVYNMVTNAYDTWGGGGPLDFARSSHTATLLSSGKVLIAGGFDNAGTPRSSLEICDPTTQTCAAIAAALSTPKAGHTAVLLSTGQYAGRVLICGGQSALDATTPTGITGSCDIFDPANVAAISAGGSLVSPRMGHSAVLMQGGKVFITGGRRRNQAGTGWLYEPLNELYDPNTNSWTPKAALNQGRMDHTATVLNNGLVLIAGGYDFVNVISSYPGRNEDVWTSEDTRYWGYDDETNQNIGSHGYLDGVEFFDSNGGRIVLAENAGGVAPYRTHRHSAILLPDGTWRMYGGYGNIVRTVFSAEPPLAEDTIIYLTKTGNTTADINPATSLVRFPLDIPLSRPVSGRLVNADAFFSAPLPPSGETVPPSIEVENAALYLTHSTAALAGLPVGTLIPNTDAPGAFEGPGAFKNTIQLTLPVGTASFEEQSLTSDSATYPNLTVNSSALTFVSPINAGDPPKPFNGTITAKAGLILPNIYRGIKGLAIVRTGSVTDPAAVYAIDITEGGSSAVDIFTPSQCDAMTCLFVATLTFTASGEISNISAATPITSPLNAAGGAITLELDLYYTADEIHTGNRLPKFTYGRSDIVIREMIFSSALGFDPKTNTWKDLADTAAYPTLNAPVFDHTAILTPAADQFILGGRNCETTPATSCPAKTFTATNSDTPIIPFHTNAEGDSEWSASGKLNAKRASHTSTLLQDGRILTCGGSNGVIPLGTCEIMDPATKTWTATGSMSISRTNHTATLLPNGAVLAAGGATSPGGVTSSAEIYYPLTQRWSPLVSMSQGRQNHAATLLPDGNVLVTGGATLSTFSATSEIYITSAAVWISSISIGQMSAPRAQHTATLLKSGNVLVTGGVNGFGAVATTEIYSFTGRTFTSPGGSDLKTARYDHTANLLRDGRVIVIGGSDNTGSEATAEIYTGTAWAYTPDLNLNRAKHRSVLLPNGKVMVTGGEVTGGVQGRAESYDPDFSGWMDQGEMPGRSHHTSVLTSDNYVVNIGGWSGSQYLDTTDIAYFSYSPDMSGLEAATQRQPEISTATSYFNRGSSVTLLSGTSNFHGITEASGGGSGPMSSSHSNPRVYMQQIDNPSGFMIDLSTRIYSLYGGVNTPATQDWGRTLSSITVISPAAAGELPYGYYHMRVAANGQFSNAQTVQVTIPRPTGVPVFDQVALQYNFLGSTSVQWTWGHSGAAADGYAVFSATNGVYQGAAAFTIPGVYTQSGLAPNTEVKISVADYNVGGYGTSAISKPYYTLASSPTNLTVQYASFETAALQWNPMGNSAATAYELSMSLTNSFATQWIAIPFSENHTSTSAVLNGLTPDQTYYFRVRARNGTELSRSIQGGVDTTYSNHATTKTVGNIGNLLGTPLSTTSIRWDWNRSVGSPYYEIYDITDGADNAVRLSSGSSVNGYTQNMLRPNELRSVVVNAYDPVTLTKGPSISASAYTLAVNPLPDVPDPLKSITTGSFILYWQTNGNPSETRYRVTTSPNSDFSASSGVVTQGHSLAVEGLSPDTLYYARITAINESGVETTPTLLGSAYTLAQPPTNLRPIAISMSGVTITWDTGNNPGGTTYEVRGTTIPNILTSGNTTGITTHLPFSSGQTSNVFALNGLMTSTTYYFDVAARNSALVETARTETVPPAYTLPGPNGAPQGSIGGTSNPSTDVTISGMLPDNRRVALSVPAGAYASQTAIAIAPSITDSCRQNLGVTPLVEVSIYTENNAQPQVPVTLTINYLADDANLITPNLSNLVMGRHNPVSGDCLPLETVINPGPRTITAKLNHFSVFQLIYKNAATDLSAVRVYPNPFYTNRGQGFVTIDNMPARTEARIYTLSGDKIWEGTAGDTGLLTWDATNSSGVSVASGIYLAMLDSTGGKKIVKIAVER